MFHVINLSKRSFSDVLTIIPRLDSHKGKVRPYIVLPPYVSSGMAIFGSASSWLKTGFNIASVGVKGGASYCGASIQHFSI